MRKLLTACLFILCYQLGFAQYADLGVGKLKKKIWWFDWSNLSITNGATRTFQINGELEVTFKFSNVSGLKLTPNTMDTWQGSILIKSYNFSNQNIKPALLTTYSNGQSSSFTITVSAKRNGNPIPFSFIASDAEASSPDENIKLTTSGGNWKTIDFFRNSTQTSNPVIGCNTKTVSITNTQDEASFPLNYGQNAILMTEASTDLIVDASILRTVYGASAVAFGILVPIDRGDLPSGYGFAHHYLKHELKNSCNYNAPFPELQQIETLRLGSVAGDADTSESLDDNAEGIDEEAISKFPDYNGNGSYSIKIPYVNTTGADAFLSGWLDTNRDGTFTPNEKVTVTIQNNSDSAILSWTGLPATFLPEDSAQFALRLRISTDANAVNNSHRYAPDGEVEDYFMMIKRTCGLEISTIKDTSICAGDSVALVSSGAVFYSWLPASGLSDPTAQSPIASPSVTTTYIVEGSDLKGCKSSSSVNLVVNQFPKVVTSADTTICLNGSVELWATGGDQYEWQSADSLNKLMGNHHSVSPVRNTLYIVKVSNGSNCSVTDSVMVKVYIPTANSLNLMPSAFTPNNDGVNDCFGLKYWDQLTELDFSIYNRFGEKVFNTTNQNDCWDGKVKGKIQPPGSFVYVIKGKTGCGVISKKGVVTLIH